MVLPTRCLDISSILEMVFKREDSGNPNRMRLAERSKDLGACLNGGLECPEKADEASVEGGTGLEEDSLKLEVEVAHDTDFKDLTQETNCWT